MFRFERKQGIHFYCAAALAVGCAYPKMEVVSGDAGGSGNGSGGSSTTGGAINTGGTAATTCAGTIPVQTGGLTVESGYVTAGSLSGYAYTWNSSLSNATTCITPTCTLTDCTPVFGTSSAICAAGNVASDTTSNSTVALGFYLSQTHDSAATISTVTIATSITVKTYTGSGAGNAYLRVQLDDNAGNSYCVEAGSWSSGEAIPIVNFNTTCWDNTGTFASSSTPIQALSVTIPSADSTDRPFGMCLQNVTVQ